MKPVRPGFCPSAVSLYLCKSRKLKLSSFPREFLGFYGPSSNTESVQSSIQLQFLSLCFISLHSRISRSKRSRGFETEPESLKPGDHRHRARRTFRICNNCQFTRYEYRFAIDRCLKGRWLRTVDKFSAKIPSLPINVAVNHATTGTNWKTMYTVYIVVIM